MDSGDGGVPQVGLLPDRTSLAEANTWESTPLGGLGHSSDTASSILWCRRVDVLLEVSNPVGLPILSGERRDMPV